MTQGNSTVPPMDIWQRIEAHMKWSHAYQKALYDREQLKEATKTPSRSRPITFNLWNPISPPIALQLLPKNDLRQEVGLINYGPADILFSNQHFDPGTILQQLSDPNDPDAIVPGYNQAIQIGLLMAGSNVNLQASEGVWAYSLGSAANANQNALISLQETIFRSGSVRRTVSEANGAPGRAFTGRQVAPFGPGGEASLKGLN